MAGPAKGTPAVHGGDTADDAVARGRPGLLVLHELVAPIVGQLSDDFTIHDASQAADLSGFLATIPAHEVVAIASLGRDGCDRSLIDRLPALKIICAIGAGVEEIDLAAARARGIPVTNAGSGNSRDVGDHAAVLWLAFRNQIEAGRAWITQDRWRREGLMPSRRSLGSERVGIVGLGNIGMVAATRAAAFGAEVAWWGPNPKPAAPWPRHASLLQLAHWATTLIVAARGGDDSRNLIDGAVMDALGPDGLLVNVARGFMVDEEVMIARLRSGALGGAALDVFADEPAGPERWRDVPNLLMTPHAAALTQEAGQQLYRTFLDNLRTALTGAPPVNVVNGALPMVASA